MVISAVISAVLYSLTLATLMSPGKDETRVCGYIRSEFIHWALWRTLMRTEYFLFVHHTTSILAKLSTWYFEYFGDISCSLLVNPSHTDESWEVLKTCLWIYIYIYIIMKRMWTPGYHHNGHNEFMATHALGHMMHSFMHNCTSCAQMHELP